MALNGASTLARLQAGLNVHGEASAATIVTRMGGDASSGSVARSAIERDRPKAGAAHSV